MRHNLNISLLVLIFFAAKMFAQEDAKILYEGNNMYHSGKIPEAAAKYSKSLEANPANKKANFNLADALYKNGMLIKSGKLSMPASAKMPADSLANMVFDQAAQNFAVVANSVSDKDTLHRAWHNIGNCYLQKKDYEQAVTAYKKALKFDPKDEETRYNLAFALKNLPKQQKQGGGGQQNQPQQKKEEQKNQQQQQTQMSKEQADQLLKAMMDAEKKLQDKRKQKQQDPSSRDVEKDW
jgi:Ca-activated chloride channel family protein